MKALIIRNKKVFECFCFSAGECVSGALYWKELFDLAQEIGFEKPRTVALSSFDITKPELKEVVGKL